MPVRRYEGARVECFNRGLSFSNEDKLVIKNDVKSQYPFVMVVLNLSPESIHILEVKPYTGEYHLDYESGILEVPDCYIGQLVLKIDKEDSITRKFMLHFSGMRDEIKRDVSLSAAQKRSHQMGIKIVLNSTYGYHGLDFSRYGSFPVAIATTAIGRLIMDCMIETAKGEKVTLIGCDTDGLITYGKNIVDKMNENVRKLFAGYPYADRLTIEPEIFDAIIFYSTKNYILRDKGANKIFGSAFHGRSMPPIVYYALQTFTSAVFEHRDLKPLWLQFYDLKKYDMRNFVMSVTLNKQEYEPETLYADLANQLEEKVWGQDIYYVKVVNGYVPLGTVKTEELKRMLDYDYYRQRIKDVVNRMLSPMRQISSKERKKLVKEGKSVTSKDTLDVFLE